jgi:hypothetical protein
VIFPLLIIVISLAMIPLAEYLAFPSRHNVFFWFSFPIAVIALPIGMLFLGWEGELEQLIDDSDLMSLAVILAVYAAVFCLTVYGVTRKKYALESRKVGRGSQTKSIRQVRARFSVTGVSILLCTSVVVVFAVAYSQMGFVPMLVAEEERSAAKYMSGEFQWLYRDAAVYFRGGLMLAQVTAAWAVVAIFYEERASRKLINVFVILAVIMVAITTLRRGSIPGTVFLSLLIALGMFDAGRLKILFVILGYLITVFLGAALFNAFVFRGSLGQLAASSLDFLKTAPDAKDLVVFWDRFNFWDRPYSYGRTFFGGMIPYHYEWNPSVYTKWVLSGYGTDVNVATGGLRLPPAVKGFYSFYWVGVIAVAALNGAIRGALINLCKPFCSSSQQLSRDSKFRLALLMIAWYYLLGNGSFFGFTLDAVVLFGLLSLLAIAVFSKQTMRYSQAVAPVHVSDLRVDSRGSRP